MMPRTRTDLPRQVRAALVHLHDLAYLQTHPLGRAIPPDPAGDARGSARGLQRALLEAIEALRPDARTGAGSPARRRHQMLVMRSTEGQDVPTVQARLGIGKSEYHREHQQALAAVVSLLTERWGLGDAVASAPSDRPTSPLAPQRPWSPKLRLPTPLTGLIGREDEVADVKRLLRSRRLLTLTGPPGTGKTRLALEVARELAGEFPDGVCFLPLASISQPTLVLPALAEAWGVREDGDSSIEGKLVEALHSAHALVVLDNFEQIVEAAPALAQLLEACPHLKALVTSRVRLSLRGECELPVSPLAVPDDRRPLTAAAVGDSAAVQLFVERACGVDPRFQLTDANAPAVAGICVRLEGLPLALELAAAHSDVLPPGELLSRLEQRLAVLTNGPRDLPARHRTLREAIASSYELLDERQKELFRHLGVFAGGWTADAAQAVAGPDDPGSVLDGLGALMRSSLVQRSIGGGNEEPRFRMLETIREYALERLIASGEAEAIRGRHADYYLGFAETAPSSAVVGLAQEWVDHVGWLERAEYEQDNLRGALARTVQRGNGEKALRLAGALAGLWIFRGGHYAEGRARLTEALALLPSAQVTRMRAVALERLGELAVRAGDYAMARTLLEEVVDAYEGLGDQRSIGYALRSLKRAFRRDGYFAEARTLDERALAIFREIGDRGGVAQVLGSLGHHFILQGEPALARSYVEEALALAPTPKAFAVLGNVASDEHNWDEARTLLGECLAIYRRLGDREGIAEALEGFAGLAAAEGAYPRAIRLLGAATAFREQTQMPLPPSWRPDLERRLRAAEDALDADERATAWEEGVRMPSEAAMDYALHHDRS